MSYARCSALAFWLLALHGISGCQLLVDRAVLPRHGIRPAEYAVRVEHDESMLTSDGVRLVAQIYRPVTQQRTPVILVRLPYSRSLKNDLGTAAIARFWASRGYTTVIQASRGRHGSGGVFYPLRDERRDGIETLQWLSRQPWYDGRLGMWGGSAFGYTQWVLADQSNPGPRALMIQIASSNFYDMFYPGGAFSLQSALFWAARSHTANDVKPSARALSRGFNGFPLNKADDRAVADIESFNDWANHPTRDAYWSAIDADQRARDIRAPVLLMAGWSDPFLPSQLRDYATIRTLADRRVATESRLIIGPWTHADSLRFPDGTVGDPYRPASLAPSIAWFDHQLMGRPEDPEWVAPVRLYVMGENRWRDEQEWPLKRAQYTQFYLQGSGRLSTAAPSDDEPEDSFIYDPRHPVPTRGGAMLGPGAGIREQQDVERRKDVLVYTTEPLSGDLEVTGPLSATLYVATTAVNTDFTVKLVDVLPNGRAYNVSDGILRRAYSHSEQATGVPAQISVELWPTSMLFRRGHRIRVQVSSSNFPRYDRNTNTGQELSTDAAPVAATQQVYHSKRFASSIVLPVVPR